VSRLRFAIALPSREYDPENMLLRAISPLRASQLLEFATRRFKFGMQVDRKKSQIEPAGICDCIPESRV
jgi:hypothetical protein